MIEGFSEIWVMIVDAFFLLFMFLLLIFIIFVSFFPIKMHHIPFVIRSHKISWWTYIMWFKLGAYGAFMIVSSFYHRYNMYDLSLGCLTCFGTTLNCLLVDEMHHACMILGSFIMLPWVILLALNCFSDKVKYVLLPIILINVLFVFALVIISNISLIWWII